MESAFGVLPKWQTDIWAALLFLDRSKIAAAKQRLEQRPCNGIRYFSSFSCVAALQDAKAVDRELRRIERQAAWEELDVARRQALTPRSS
jgi:hypothetical protein